MARSAPGAPAPRTHSRTRAVARAQAAPAGRSRAAPRLCAHGDGVGAAAAPNPPALPQSRSPPCQRLAPEQRGRSRERAAVQSPQAFANSTPAPKPGPEQDTAGRAKGCLLPRPGTRLARRAVWLTKARRGWDWPAQGPRKRLIPPLRAETDQIRCGSWGRIQAGAPQGTGHAEPTLPKSRGADVTLSPLSRGTRNALDPARNSELKKP
ncbi:hypothetical protein KIL84_016829 [Mauremys mutica]|uniref:Uncharacterized protein n=1 Tax=Mauremys mutica TaxID=74926 RepID=A0A9D3X5B4_9SAUR|nr:hypothetical protein KIL84_016829 [Mauremys mutica]